MGYRNAPRGVPDEPIQNEKKRRRKKKEEESIKLKQLPGIDSGSGSAAFVELDRV